MPNIALIGAGSASFSLDLLRDVVLNRGLSGSKMTLVDIDEERLAVAHALATRYRDEVGADIQFEATTERKRGIEGADFVICAVKVGGYGPLEAERAIAERHGYYRGIGDRALRTRAVFSLHIVDGITGDALQS
jgi:alpha-galactosidase